MAENPLARMKLEHEGWAATSSKPHLIYQKQGTPYTTVAPWELSHLEKPLGTKIEIQVLLDDWAPLI